MDDFYEPLQTYFTNTRVLVRPYLNQISRIKIGSNEFEDNRDRFGFLFSDPDPKIFISETEQEILSDYTSESPLPNLQFIIELSNQHKIIERKQYTIFTLIGDFGGFNAAVLSIPAIFMGFYAEKMFKAAVLEEIPVKYKSDKNSNINSIQEKFANDDDAKGQVLDKKDI